MGPKMKKEIAVTILTCILAAFIGCSDDDHDAAYIYEINGAKQGRAVVTLTWDDQEELKTIAELVNEAASSSISNQTVKMEYEIELINSNVKNDRFKIGFIDGKVCCTGKVQEIEFDYAVSTSTTENDLKQIIDN